MCYTGPYLCRPAQVVEARTSVGGVQAKGGGQTLTVAVELLDAEGLEERWLVEEEAAVVIVGAEEDGEEREAQALGGGGVIGARRKGETVG